MIINVTQEHIDKGQPRKVCECPVALAIMQALGITEPRSVFVGLGNISTRAWVKPTPVNVMKFIIEFDAFHRVEPFNFWLDV